MHRRGLRRSLWVLIGGAVLILAYLAAPYSDGLTARQILDRSANVYAGCKTYRDSGVVKIVVSQTLTFDNLRRDPVGPWFGAGQNSEWQFTTAFVRPGRFRFEGNSRPLAPAGRNIVCRNGEEIQTWPASEVPQSVDSALANLDVFPCVSARPILALLAPDGRPPLKPVVKRTSDAKLDEIDCFRIEVSGLNVPGVPGGVLWIDKTSLLVRKIEQATKLDNYRATVTTTYDPVVNDKITEEMLEFNPPG